MLAAGLPLPMGAAPDASAAPAAGCAEAPGAAGVGNSGDGESLGNPPDNVSQCSRNSPPHRYQRTTLRLWTLIAALG